MATSSFYHTRRAETATERAKRRARLSLATLSSLQISVLSSQACLLPTPGTIRPDALEVN